MKRVTAPPASPKTVKPGWTMPQRECCGTPCEPCALHEDGWWLHHFCHVCGEMHDMVGEWPFVEDRAGGHDLERLGFTIA